MDNHRYGKGCFLVFNTLFWAAMILGCMALACLSVVLLVVYHVSNL